MKINRPAHNIGDLVRSKTRYKGQIFMVTETIPAKPCNVYPIQKIRLIRVEDGFRTRYSKASTWERLA